jgi:hypothetical protein
MDMRRYAKSSFIRFDDVKGGPREGTIIKVTEGQFGKPDLLFDTGERLSVNPTNTTTLIEAYGPNDQDWLGMRIKLFAGTTPFQGKEQDSVLVEPISPGKPEAERTPLPANSGEMNDEIPF